MSNMREAFEDEANEIGMVLDCHFFEGGNNYTDPETRLAYRLFSAGFKAGSENQNVPPGFVLVPVESAKFCADITIQAMHCLELSPDGALYEKYETHADTLLDAVEQEKKNG